MKLLKTIRRITLWIIAAFFILSVGGVVIYKYMPVYITPLMVVRCVQQVKQGESMKLHHKWVSMDKISQHLPYAVVVTEDQRFVQHNGFDSKEIQNALRERESGKRKRGASTISQQTAKNVFLCNGGGWVRKVFEAYFTVLIEFVWGKQRIMEVYLNSIEMGDGIYGAEAVAKHHFNTTAAKLTKEQAALIAISLPNPLKRNSARPGNYMRSRQSKVVSDISRVERTKELGEF